MHEVISLENVSKSFPQITAVKDLSLAIRAGEVIALLGENGAGKSTTIDMILGYTEPTNGTVTVLGQPAGAIRSSGRIAAVPQSGGLLPDLTVRETVELVAAAQGATREQFAAVMGRASIDEIADRRVSKCSGGEAQRLRFAMALLPDPDILILDEPTTGMDVAARQRFWEAIKADAEAGRTIIFATHYLHEAEDFAQRIVVMKHGEIVADGTLEDIQKAAAGRYIKVAGLSYDELEVLQLRYDTTVTTEAGRSTFLVADESADDCARYLLSLPTARDIEVHHRNLEDAFLTLTR